MTTTRSQTTETQAHLGPLRELLDGNRRFAAGKPKYPRDIAAARATATEQHPAAAVFTCVDSRVPAETIFDCDFGQLIVVRTAGQVPDPASVASLGFAVKELSVPLVMVLGHERCGAIELAVEACRPDAGDAPGGYLVERLRPVATEAWGHDPERPQATAMRLQVRSVVRQLVESGECEGATVVGARYDLDSGLVDLID
ncbi:carbonic anhydrase [Stackebrandtia albiflava]|uniref:Carbonic anhydrase n=1 Tax=Stackebrandtia albiflava TaxID=406432 RepID=A0A562UQY8_9ACTN|nr:carbonic anhydrase [Stackebrandtia albiflava]TWJ08016.1 carbonic anhydrase [Stackebrandtia albiflava]